MDELYIQMMTEMGVSLAELVAKGTASTVTKKVRAIKDVKDAEKLRVTYDSLLNEVLQEREEAIRIAQAYKAEIDRIVISDDDIKHLHATVSRVLDVIKTFAPNTPVESIESIKELISVDVLKTMQLLGFNYKAAIGEPLTALCANAISSWGNKKSSSTNNNQQKRK